MGDLIFRRDTGTGEAKTRHAHRQGQEGRERQRAEGKGTRKKQGRGAREPSCGDVDTWSPVLVPALPLPHCGPKCFLEVN